MSRSSLGVTLVEVVVAIMLLGLVVPPLFQAFYQSQALTQRQMNQEIALKLAEALLNQSQAVEFKILSNPPTNASIPLNLELPGKPPLRTSIPMSGKPPSGSVIFPSGGTTFKLSIRAEKVFPGQGNAPSQVLFTYGNDKGLIATYPCPDNFVMVETSVEFLSGIQSQTVSLRTCRAD